MRQLVIAVKVCRGRGHGRWRMHPDIPTLTLLVLLAQSSRPLAFDGALGFGRFAKGGSGGALVVVTSLLVYLPGQTPIPGTLRWAIDEVAGPRIITFAVSGRSSSQRNSVSSARATRS